MQDRETDPPSLDPGAFRVALGEMLRGRREELGLTQSALASELNIRPSRIWEWEKGLHVLRWDRLFLVCGALRITPTEIVARAETRTRDLMREGRTRPGPKSTG
jgi:transcriptional regulator with XRE-family HTH domain